MKQQPEGKQTTIIKKRRRKKKGGKARGCGGLDLSKGDVWVVGGANAQDPQGWKRPGGCGGWGLGSTEQKGPRCAFRLWSQRAGDPTWEPSRLSGL